MIRWAVWILNEPSVPRYRSIVGPSDSPETADPSPAYGISFSSCRCSIRCAIGVGSIEILSPLNTSSKFQSSTVKGVGASADWIVSNVRILRGLGHNHVKFQADPFLGSHRAIVPLFDQSALTTMSPRSARPLGLSGTMDFCEFISGAS
jgi:hypothetical protein